jgi:thymidylate kinase
VTEVAPPAVALPVIEELLRRLDDAGVRYCHWKSTTRLAEALRGETDLDLLVAAQSAPRFRAIVGGLGFREFVSHPSRRLPGVEDWLGLEPSVPRLVHLHVYGQLILGEDLVKNHHLPIEQVVLSAIERRDGMVVPTPEVELAILAVRALLKYRDGAYLRDRFRPGRRGGLAAGIRSEVADLLRRTTPSSVAATVEERLPMLPSSVLAEFLELAIARPPDARRLRSLRLRLEEALRPYRRMGAVEVAKRRAAAAVSRSRPVRRIREAASRGLGQISGRRKTAAAGGCVVAIVGIDGAGKTTLLRELNAIFGWRINVATLYLGSSRPSPPTRIAQAAHRLSRRMRGAAARGHLPRSLSAPVDSLESGANGLRAAAEAADRRRRALRGRDLAARGWLVLVDRYPMPDLEVGGRALDALRLGSASGASGAIEGRFVRAERRLYRDIPTPDLTLLLRIDPTAAMGRKREPGRRLEEKAAALDRWALSMPEGVVVLDASKSVDDLRRQAAQAVWEALA